MQAFTRTLSKTLPGSSSTFRRTASASQRSVVQTKGFHSSAAVLAKYDPNAYKVVDELGAFPTSSFDEYRRSQTDSNVNRAFTYAMVGGVGAVTASAAKNTVFDLLAGMSATADVVALANIEYELNEVPVGSTVTVKWRGKPLFLKHRTPEEIAADSEVPMVELRDPQTDAERAKVPEWVLVLGICTHLGCVPLANAGDYSGWFCPCHGSHYDSAGRIRRGPAPRNLEIPPHKFIDENTIYIGDLS